MYTPEYFKVTDEKEIFAFIEANAFGQLISSSGGRLFSTHLPFLLSEDKTSLLGHLARQNQQLQDIENQEVMVTLQGAHDYISPSWYVNPGVPTWNYQAAHVYGRCSVFTGRSDLKKIVDTLTSKYESQFDTPWKPDYNPSMLGAIVGIKIAISANSILAKIDRRKIRHRLFSV